MDTTIYLTDKSGKRFFNTTCGYGYHFGELHNQQRRLAMAKAGGFTFIDAETAKLVMLVNGAEVIEKVIDNDDELLRELLG